MKYLVPLRSLTLTLLLAGVIASNALAQQRPAPSTREVLTNEAIISLTKAGFKERTIVTLIRTSATSFDISTLKLVEMKKRGVSERVIAEMIEIANRGEVLNRLSSLRDDEFFAKDDDAFFNGPIFKELPSEKEAKRREDEAQIFGSQSGGGSRTRSRGIGPNGERSDQGEVTGSASVRLVRPSGEQSNAAPRLERAPKLDNRGVLEMIQAGFSEGTVLRKIEGSQVEFDMSAKALEDLRRNRVSERVISAMKTAMDESK
jgi:hypothetical protein